jgi:hypothetical protein
MISIRPQRSWVEDKAMLDFGVWVRLVKHEDHFESPRKADGSRTMEFTELRTSCGGSVAHELRLSREQVSCRGSAGRL